MANPENTANDQASAPTSVPNTNARAQFEAERMTRRAALRKFGFGAGMAALLALSTDDLARMAAAKLKQHAGDNQVANQVANEFKNAGVSFAADNGQQALACTDSGNISDFCWRVTSGAPAGQHIAQCKECCTNAYGSGVCSEAYVEGQTRDNHISDCQSACDR